jgi:hypothetical protein
MGADSRANREQPVTVFDRGYKVSIAICKMNLGKPGIRIDVDATPRPVVVLSPGIDAAVAHNEEIRIGTYRAEFIDWYPNGFITSSVSPPIAESYGLQTHTDVIRGIVEVGRNLF